MKYYLSKHWGMENLTQEQKTLYGDDFDNRPPRTYKALTIWKDWRETK